MSAAFETALRRLGLVDRNDPAAVAVAKMIIELAKEGERDPERLCCINSWCLVERSGFGVRCR
jgi:hypothetical protein